ncbi:hypothetical protein [Hymenobacter metallicola]|uniref:Uncharacterized protein n=1 Tax=Hymenobacter metallicola TaxID=2563114 RepID=A0A4Z0QEL9_9BACT|nr:hypothetical protein [Hymenobacter metallicola]TGE28498.1 hypothetical protein E5K02_03250 [Hymenobacter metallicola]
MTRIKEYLPNLIATIWLLCWPLVLLTYFTPLEFVPLQLGNLPRLGLWLLAFPATRWLKTRTRILSWLWTLLPWLMWGPLVLVQLVVVASWYQKAKSYTPGKFQWTSWRQAVIPVEDLFVRQYPWHTVAFDYRQGDVVAVRQLRFTNAGAEPRRVIITPVMPGLQWCVPIPYDSLLKAPWQMVDTVAARELERVE